MREKQTEQDSPAFDHWGGALLGERASQQDFHIAMPLAQGCELLLIVADGMGGHVGGEIASEVAATAFADCFAHHTVGAPPRRLRIALAMANEALAERIRAEPELDGMGTTLVAAHLSAAGLAWVSVGDSLLLHLRGSKIRRLNEDHSMAPVIERRFLAGELTRAEADIHPERNELLSVLAGWYSPDMVDCPDGMFAMAKDDRIILASDGLNTLDMAAVLEAAIGAARRLNAQQAVQQMLGAIEEKARKFQDNVAIELAVVC